MSHSSLVSILIPTYQGEKFLSETLDSALSQTYPNLEIIISDDGSTDKTLDIAKSYQEKTSIPFTLLAHENMGMVNNWNNCIDKANGKYLKFLFQDDIIAPDCIEEMVNLAEQDPEMGLVFSRREIILSEEANEVNICLDIYNSCRNLHSHWSRLNPIQSGQELLRDPKLLDNPLNKIGEPSTVLIKKEVFDKVGKFDPELLQIVDLDMWLRIMIFYKVGFIDQILSSFRLHPHQQSIKNIEIGEGNRDNLRFYKKLLTASCYNCLPESLKLKLYKYVEKDRDDLEKQRDRGNARIKQLEEHEAELEAELRKTQSDFFRTQAQLEEALATLEIIKNSKLGKINYAWMKFKQALQLSPKR
ncbi:glycosyl transferase family 2 [Gloeothece citriformis PCC 7424]|uniref:Glycosyl transferase family 2 n=1 Tax=Gloeothece citriformis (strain PCC 7424) TaxID=65393 RepID=B7K810_GLOC7|nr:glycosyltransferase [Gloeothece citriformis]ACK68498.1 glycosyl transferase family 2 [Gloeothece citriformis PCC 7424]